MRRLNVMRTGALAALMAGVCDWTVPVAIATSSAIVATAHGADPLQASPGAPPPTRPQAPPAAPLLDELGGVASTHLLARVRPGVRVAHDALGRPTLRLASGALSDGFTTSAAALGVTSIEAAPRVAPADRARAAAIGLDRFVRIEVPAGTDTPAMAAALMRDFGGADGPFEIVECDGVGGLAETIPNDANFNLQYGMRNTGQVVAGQTGVVDADIDATNAWDSTTGSASIVIALLDSGLNDHPEITGRILVGTNIPQQNGNTADGCSSHGTHVAGIAAATGNNGIGVAGVCWNAQLLPIVVVNPCTGLESYVADGLTWAADHGADIANMSLQYSAGTEYLHAAVQYAAAAGMVLVAAAGNNNSGVAYPAKWPECIAVAATDNQDKRWASSNFGPEIDVAAPGWQVYSLNGSDSYAYKTGTSMATPHVSGIAALLWSIKPTLTADQIRALIETTCDDIATPGFDNLTGHGRVNAASAVAALLASIVPGDLNEDGVVDGADMGLLLGAWGPCPACDTAPCAADLDGSCTVDGADLGLLIGNWS
ncbi:MAG: S8 family serine peptidase [Phycisphaerales bacterium]